MLPVVVHADLRACGFGTSAVQCLGGVECGDAQLIAVTNTTVVDTETMSELLRKIAALGLTGAITLVLDNARYQHNAAVKALASQVGITLLFLPSYSQPIVSKNGGFLRLGHACAVKCLGEDLNFSAQRSVESGSPAGRISLASPFTGTDLAAGIHRFIP